MRAAIVDEIRSFVASSTLNLSRDGYRYFSEPLVGFADAEDALFSRYKDVIGSFHMAPREWFDLEFTTRAFSGGTVISWVLPLSEAVGESNRKESAFPSRRWAHARFHGEQFNNALRRQVIDHLSSAGYRAVSPALSNVFQWITSGSAGLASNWSERHAAYAAGLGTFSLNDGLITERGIAHRCGSVITDLKVEPDQRNYSGVHDYCLYLASGTCGACISRCPVGAISKEGHDKEKCFAYTRDVVIPTVNDDYQVTTPSCGLCQTRVPCERRIPGSTTG